MSKKPVPSKKQARSSTRSRWATYVRKARQRIMDNLSIVQDEDGSSRLSHHVNLKTGKYKGRQILTPKRERTGGAVITEIEA